MAKNCAIWAVVACALAACGGPTPEAFVVPDVGSSKYDSAHADVHPSPADAADPVGCDAPTATDEDAGPGTDAGTGTDAVAETDASGGTDAGMSVEQGGEIVPQTVLNLKSLCPACESGQTCTYNWTVKQPSGSNKAIETSSSPKNSTFQPDVAGEYVFCVEVTDAGGAVVCAQVCKTVLVVPDKAVHVELLWDTPADPDQTDTGPAAGADMDLHFASSLAAGPDLDCDGAGDPWFSPTFDCFWYNPRPEWSSANSCTYEEPTLDLDDTDGAGPENLSLDAPQGILASPSQYAIGVHYWDDHGYGVSFATLTVYLVGSVALKIDKVSMNPWDMWYVAKLNWPNSLTGGTLAPFDVCHQSGDTCSGKGKMWQPKGDWCITPCYNPKLLAALGLPQPANCKKP